MTDGASFRQLDANRILETLVILDRRVRERFPDAGLAQVSRELVEIARQSRERVRQMARPNWPVRLGVGALIVGLLVLIASAVANLNFPGRVDNLAELLQVLESGVNDLVFLGIGIFFLVRVESRLKRHKALQALHELRSISHIIDMHQLTKDPEQLLSPEQGTESSPPRPMTRFELARYLDYCSELLSLISKLAALYVQGFDDAVVLSAVNEVETLTNGLSRKIWQKIMILDVAVPRTTGTGHPA